VARIGADPGKFDIRAEKLGTDPSGGIGQAGMDHGGSTV